MNCFNPYSVKSRIHLKPNTSLILKVLLTISSILGLALKEGKAQANEIKMVHTMDKPIIEASINGKKALFVLDSGSSLTILNSSMARHFKFKVVGPRYYGKSLITSFGGSIQELRNVYQANVAIGGHRIDKIQYAYNMDRIVQSIYNRTGLKIAGLIGSDVMYRYGFKIDYVSRAVSIEGRKKNTKRPIVATNKS